MHEEDGLSQAAWAEAVETTDAPRLHEREAASDGAGGPLGGDPPVVGSLAPSPVLLDARPPCLPPRRRPLAPAMRAQLAEWTRLALGLSQTARIDVEEWVATDSRLTPHVVQITVQPHGFRVTIEKASERVSIGDVFGAFVASSPRA